MRPSPKSACSRPKRRNNVSFSQGQERGGAVVNIAAPSASARIALQGAQLLSWTPHGFTDVLWCSSLSQLGGGKAIRGGVPVCWPWFGPHAHDTQRPQHGFARNLPWQLERSALSGDTAELTFALAAEDCAAFTPEHDLSAELTLRIGQRLEMSLTTINRSSTTAPLSIALHTYLAVSDVATIEIDGLDGANYRDNTRGGVATPHSGPMRIAGETIALFDEAPQRQTVIDPSANRKIIIDRANAGSTIVWNPGANANTMADIPPGAAKHFVCVESGVIGRSALALAPGARHTLDVAFSVVPL
jgi:glucose-6-phosphate 1-epimerase